MLDFQKLSAQYHQTLLRQVVPFWLKNSQDGLCGGYFDLLDAAGQPIEGDKFASLQAQQAWAFSWLYNTFDGQSAWLEHARHGINFLSQFAHDDTLSCYGQLDRRGRPIAEATDWLPDMFAVMTYAQFHRATGEDEWAMLAKQTFANAWQRKEDLRQKQAAEVGKLRSLLHLSEPLSCLKAVQTLQPLLDEESWKQHIETVLQEILTDFVDRRTDTLREYILPEGAFLNTPEGRRINVGLTFQTAGYLFDLYVDNSPVKNVPNGLVNRKLAAQIVTWCLQACEQGWDEASSGLNQYVDQKRQTSIFMDWQQKWAWVHLEALAALLKGYVYTRHPDCLRWFKRIHDYTFQHFPDLKQSGWHLAIDLYATPLLAAKAIPSAGCYSQIRCLTEIAQLLPKCVQIESSQQAGRSRLSLNS